MSGAPVVVGVGEPVLDGGEVILADDLGVGRVGVGLLIQLRIAAPEAVAVGVVDTGEDSQAAIGTLLRVVEYELYTAGVVVLVEGSEL